MVVETDDKKRFMIFEDGLRIRAPQGHCAKRVSTSYRKVVPPDWLYHGMASRFLPSILAEALVPNVRHHVHPSGLAFRSGRHFLNGF